MGGRGAAIGSAGSGSGKIGSFGNHKGVPKDLRGNPIPEDLKEYVKDNIHELTDPNNEANCQRSSLATELAFRGLSVDPVSNQALDDTYGETEASRIRSLDGIISVFDNPEISTVDIPGTDIRIYGKAVIDGIKDAISSAPIGARFLVSSGSHGEGEHAAGHNVLIEKNSNISFVTRDGYEHDIYHNSLGRLTRYMMQYAEDKQLTLIRTDNAKFNNNLSKIVKSSNRITEKLQHIKDKDSK